MELLRPRVESPCGPSCSPEVLVRRDDSPMREMEGLPAAPSQVMPEGAAPKRPCATWGSSSMCPWRRARRRASSSTSGRT